MPACITTAARGACRSMPPTPPTGSTCRPATARPGATTATRVPSPPACATNAWACWRRCSRRWPSMPPRRTAAGHACAAQDASATRSAWLPSA
ncbi:hypothetical protein G6F24_016108 [Rhizopus arrhizus]|nr:hypothetical protein G6F24_016108 [Rhizopus arrhizus]